MNSGASGRVAVVPLSVDLVHLFLLRFLPVVVQSVKIHGRYKSFLMKKRIGGE